MPPEVFQTFIHVLSWVGCACVWAQVVFSFIHTRRRFRWAKKLDAEHEKVKAEIRAMEKESVALEVLRELTEKASTVQDKMMLAKAHEYIVVARCGPPQKGALKAVN